MSKFESDAYRATLTGVLAVGGDNSTNGRPEQQLGHRPLPQSPSSTTSAVAIFGSNLPPKIDPDGYYPPQADELRPVAAVQTLARWRHEGRGPPYIKSGSRVLYRGADVLAWLEANWVKTEPPLTGRESACEQPPPLSNPVNDSKSNAPN